jgi:hypothetical protein
LFVLENKRKGIVITFREGDEKRPCLMGWKENLQLFRNEEARLLPRAPCRKPHCSI